MMRLYWLCYRHNNQISVVIKYIEARPERMHEQFGDLAIEALMAAWPCKR